MSWWDYDYTPTTNFNSSPTNYSLSSGGSSMGLKAPTYQSYDSPYSFTGSGQTSGGMGLQLPSGGSFGSGYQLYDSSWAGGQGLRAPAAGGGTVTSGGTFGGFQPQAPQQSAFMPSIYAAPGGGSSFSLASPMQVGAAPGQGVQFQQGAGVAPSQPGLRAPVGQSGLTGSFGGVGGTLNPNAQRTPSTLEAVASTQEGQKPGLVERATGALNRMEQWGQQNPRLASAIGQGIGALASYAGQRQAAKNIKAQEALQQQAIASQQQAVQRNNQQADFWNQQATQSANEARSLYNPQELGVRGMAQQVAATGRREQEARQAAMKRGMSAADAEAEARRVKLAGSQNATTGYLAGLDIGRQAQQAALSGAKGLSSQYAGLNYQPNTALAQYYAQQGQATGDQLRALLEFYTGDPSRRVIREREEAETRSSTS